MTEIRFDILSIFPEAFSSIASVSILKRAILAGRVELVLHDIRQYADGSHRCVDDSPYGGGAGMVMKAAPVIDAVEDVEQVGKKYIRIMLTPQGEQFTQKVAKKLAKYNQIALICGHYEGLDQRARDRVVDMELSIGDYVLTGGELPAFVVCEAVSRLIKGVLGNVKSHEDETFEGPRLEYPQYTRPANLNGMKVPEVLLSGDMKKIDKWRETESILKTKKVRPDLLKPQSGVEGEAPAAFADGGGDASP